MAIGAPIIRSGAVAPILRWLHESGLGDRPFLAATALDLYPIADPLSIIPWRAVVHLLSQVSKAYGPDTPYRIIDGRGFYEIGLLGTISLGGKTPREVFRRAVSAMPYHCSHEFITLEEVGPSLVVGYGVKLTLHDQESIHFVQQYVFAMIEMVLAMTHLERPWFTRVTMVPHPQIDFTHLRNQLGDAVTAGEKFEIEIPRDVVDSLLRVKPINPLFEAALRNIEPLPKNNAISDCIATLVANMMLQTKPNIDQIARSVGISRRSLQRALAQEGLTFSQIVEDVRKKAVLSALETPHVSLAELSSRVGFAQQATLTRAVRRWSGQTPSDLKGP